MGNRIEIFRIGVGQTEIPADHADIYVRILLTTGRFRYGLISPHSQQGDVIKLGCSIHEAV